MYYDILFSQGSINVDYGVNFKQVLTDETKAEVVNKLKINDQVLTIENATAVIIGDPKYIVQDNNGNTVEGIYYNTLPMQMKDIV